MDILLYDLEKTYPEDVCEVVRTLHQYNIDIIALPNCYSILQDCSIETLITIRDQINDAIKAKENTNG